ncbi:hypothetical protein LX36DRAFT_366239 [Colletotrichum falcatum]|nr:hypothetical protein LX36DRAFT_366239 [Colletotrichum falcatum]
MLKMFLGGWLPSQQNAFAARVVDSWLVDGTLTEPNWHLEISSKLKCLRNSRESCDRSLRIFWASPLGNLVVRKLSEANVERKPSRLTVHGQRG